MNCCERFRTILICEAWKHISFNFFSNSAPRFDSSFANYHQGCHLIRLPGTTSQVRWRSLSQEETQQPSKTVSSIRPLVRYTSVAAWNTPKTTRIIGYNFDNTWPTFAATDRVLAFLSSRLLRTSETTIPKISADLAKSIPTSAWFDADFISAVSTERFTAWHFW